MPSKTPVDGLTAANSLIVLLYPSQTGVMQPDEACTPSMPMAAPKAATGQRTHNDPCYSMKANPASGSYAGSYDMAAIVWRTEPLEIFTPFLSSPFSHY